MAVPSMWSEAFISNTGWVAAMVPTISAEYNSRAGSSDLLARP